jgi:outer membrane protein OmpA-like peptidoglycan-associated protein
MRWARSQSPCYRSAWSALISNRNYFEFRLGTDRYALARPSLLRATVALGEWFDSVYGPPFKASAEPAWNDLPRLFACDLFERWLREAGASERNELLAWLARRAGLAAPYAASEAARVLREARADLGRRTLVVFRRHRPLYSSGSAQELAKPPLVQLGPEPQRFAVRWVDEQGQGIAGLPLEFTHAGGAERQSTDPSGTGCLRSTSSSATVHVADEGKLRQLLKTRWSKPGANQPWLTSRDALVVPLGDGRLPSIDLSPEAAHLVSVQPDITRLRLLGGFFDSSKCFILPRGLSAVRAVVGMYGRQANAKLLIVGHTDTAGTPEYNDPLSLERARALKDYLTDNVDGWLGWYGDGVATDKRWGAAEDRMMIDALPDAAARAKTEHPVRWFQRTRGLHLDGIAGPETRKALVAAYMDLDGTSLPAGSEAIVHGCGETFPQKPTGDGKTEPENRRVEVFFFPGSLGVLPAPSSDN